MEKLLPSTTYDLIRKYLKENPDGDSLGIELYKAMIKCDIDTLSDLNIKIQPKIFRDYISKTLDELGYGAAAEEVRFCSRIKVKEYALWTALRIYGQQGVDFVCARHSDDQDMRDMWVTYCRLLCIAIHYDPPGEVEYV